MDEEKIKEAYIAAWNVLVENKEDYILKWKQVAQGADLLKVYKAKQFTKLVESIGMIEKIDNDFLLKTLECIKVCDKEVLVVRFLDWSEIECGGG